MTPELSALRTKVITARAAYRRGEVTIQELEKAADDYIAGVVARAATLSPKIRRRFKVPSRAYVLRAL